MLEAKDVNFAYMRGQPVIKDMDCKIEDGEFVALLGHNGSGKTTLSRLFMALCHPRSGQVFIDGEDIVKREPADLADKIGYVFQNPDLQILEDTVFDEVAYGPRAKKLTEATIERQVNEALKAMGLTELKDEYPRLLSFGQKRRLGVAAALALNPRTFSATGGCSPFLCRFRRTGCARKGSYDELPAGNQRKARYYDCADFA